MLCADAMLAFMLVCSLPTEAGGLYLNEFATPSEGNAGAGREALADNASTAFAFANPAGMTRLQGNQLNVGGGLGVTRIEFDPAPNTPVPGNDGGDAGGLAPLLGSAFTYSASDRLKFGVNLGSFSAALLDYNDAWTGRFQVEETTIFTIALNPSVAYRINDRLSLGAGFSVVYGKLDFKLATPPQLSEGQVKLDGLDDTAFSFNLGALYELNAGTRFGLIYISQLDFDFDGKVEFRRINQRPRVNTEIKLAQLIRLGAYHELNDRVALLGSFGWEDWSVLGDQFIGTANIQGVIPRNWKDTWHYSLGLNYKLDSKWTLQTGFTYSTSPVSAADRTADLPVDRQVRIAVGARYAMRDNLTISGSIEYADFGTARINDNSGNGLIGDYAKNNALFFAINGNWTF